MVDIVLKNYDIVYRVPEMGRRFSLPFIRREDIPNVLEGMIKFKWQKKINSFDFKLIDQRKSRFI